MTDAERREAEIRSIMKMSGIEEPKKEEEKKPARKKTTTKGAKK